MRPENRIYWLALLAAVFAMDALRCSNLDLAGTVTQSGNGIVSGMVVESGVPASGARVLLLPIAYDPYAGGPLPDSLIDTTGPAGEYRIIAPANAVYNVEVSHVSGRSVLAAGISVSEGDTIVTPPLALKPPADLLVLAPEQPGTTGGYVYLPGTTCYGMVRDDSALISGVPSGFIAAIYYANTTDSTQNRVIRTSFIVPPARRTVLADYSGWRYSKKLYLNTTAGGAGITGNVCGFPVLVRLTATTFDFSQARGSGADLRFTKSDNFSPLSFEIENWDSAAATAAVWVKVDTVYGNNSSQFIWMYWDAAKTGPLSAAAGRTVFDTADRFEAVWHLAESGSAAAGNYRDATANRNNGQGVAMAAGNQVIGIIGKAQVFDGYTGYIEVPYSPSLNPETFTVSCWARSDSLNILPTVNDSAFHSPVTCRDTTQDSGNARGYLLYHNNSNIWAGWIGSGKLPWSGELPSGPAVEKGAWVFLTLVYNGTNLKLYTDGILRLDNAYPFSKNTRRPLRIGAGYTEDLPRYFFNGIVDEVVVAGTSRSADWIRLCYMNQKADDALIRMK